MFLKNFWEYVRIQSLYTDQFNKSANAEYKSCSIAGPNGATYVNIFIDSKSGSGQPNYYPNNPNQSLWQDSMLYFKHLFYGFKAHVGIGTTDPTPFDYNLASNADSSFDQVSTTQTYGVNEAGHFVLQLTWTGRNNTNSPITITEVGATKYMMLFSNTSTGVDIYVARHVLTSPITIDSMSSASIIFECEIF